MNTRRAAILSVIAAGLVALVALPATASATIAVSPGSLTFPERQVGTQSDPQVVTVQVFCTNPGIGCMTNDGFTYAPTLVGDHPQDFSATNLSCPPFLPNNGLAPGVCQFNVRFKPTAPGTRQAVLIAGTGQTSQPNPVVLNGTAVAAPTAPPPTKKKCKKKKGKKKKCKKKAPK